MRTSTPVRTITSVMLASIVIAACGQKVGVRVDGEVLADGTGLVTVPGDGGTVTDGTVTDGTVTDGTVTDGTVIDDGTGAVGTTDGTGGDGTGGTAGGETTTTTTPGSGGGDAGGGGGDGGGGDAGGGAGGGGGGGGGGGAAPPTSGKKAVTGSDRTGVTADKLTIGLHAPATGAAPLPVESFDKARNTYWNYVLKGGGKVLGRTKVEVLFQDDKYVPESAIQVCRELASKSFMVVGGGGTDQVQACATLAARDGIPYFSAGVTEAGLEANDWYFAASMTYRQQGGLLAQYVKKDPDGIKAPGADGTVAKVLGPGAKIGTIITNSPNFEDALAGWEAGLKANGLTNLVTYKHTKGKNDWIGQVADDFQKKGVNVVYFLSAPVIYLDFVNAADVQYSYNPLYVGVGVSKGLNAVLRGGCKAPGKRDDNGIFLSPFPGEDRAPAEFLKASADQGAPADDIALALWGLAEGQHKLFQGYEATYGTDLTRQDFRNFVEQDAGTIKTSVYPATTYKAGKGGHFGANTSHVLEANCASKKFETRHMFAAGF